MNSTDKILKKLNFTIRVEEDQPGEGGIEPLSISFIYGIGIEGLSDFERAVSDLNPGDSIRVDIPPGRLRDYLGPLSGLLGRKMAILESARPKTLICKLAGLDVAEPQEVVAAIAQMQKAGGCASGCGCGCGGH